MTENTGKTDTDLTTTDTGPHTDTAKTTDTTKTTDSALNISEMQSIKISSIDLTELPLTRSLGLPETA